MWLFAPAHIPLNALSYVELQLSDNALLVLATVPNSRCGSVSCSSTEPDCCNGFYHTKPGPLQLGRFYHPKPGISTSQVWLLLSIWVLIILWHDQYVDCSVLACHSLPAVKFAIRTIFIQSQLKIREIHMKYCVISQPLEEYWSDRKTECERWMGGSNCTIYILIMSWFNQNSDT